jgi:hypothetical protein
MNAYLKTQGRRKGIAFFVCLILVGSLLAFSFPRLARAVRPLSSALSFVAGEGTSGFRDGSFTTAWFKTPMGLAISPDGTRLFLADSGNHRVRVIHLDQDNKVTTLAGQDKPGKKDGDLASAQFNQPHQVVYLPGERLAVNDFGNKLLRLVDLNTGAVSTLAGSKPTTLAEGKAEAVSMAGIRDMVYLPQADSLFFSQPEKLALKRLDLKTGQVTLAFNGQKGLIHPAALCVTENRVFMSDRDGLQVYGLDWKDGVLSAPATVASGSGLILALTFTGDHLYAFQSSPTDPLYCLFPQSQPVSFMTVWGDEIPNPGNWLYSFVNVTPEDPPGFVPDPLEPRKLYIVNPSLNMVTSFRDLTGNQDIYGNICRIEPPAKKPPKTFRILFVGDSRSVMIVPFPFPMKTQAVVGSDNPPQLAISKRLELELNTLAALDDAPMNFEVINDFCSATEPLFLWPTYHVPPMVKAHDIDLVVIMEPPTPADHYPFLYYFMNPITKEGIPLYPNDMEYLVKPPWQRIPNGDPRRFYEMCKERHYVRIKGNNFVFDEKLFQDPALHDLLENLYIKPLDLLNHKLAAMRTSTGQPVRVVLFSTHTGLMRPNLEDPSIWADAAKKFHVPILDVNDEMTAVRLSFFPLNELGNNDHLNPSGHTFMASILAHGLIRDKLIPWTGSPQPSPVPPEPTATTAR